MCKHHVPRTHNLVEGRCKLMKKEGKRGRKGGGGKEGEKDGKGILLKLERGGGEY